MKHNLLLLIGVVCLMTSCLEENFHQPSFSYDNEVSFSATLNKVNTKTLYDQAELLACQNSVKVNWVHGDLITVYGDQCTAVKQANYQVGTVTVNEQGQEQVASGQSYANYLKKTGDAGVQWGDANVSDFYALYPATTNQFTSTTNGVEVMSSIRSIQTNKFEYDATKKLWIGTPYNGDMNNPSMCDAVMYAFTPSATANDGAVDLSFMPFSTVLKFKFNGISFSTNNTDPVNITKIVLNAPSVVAGDFKLNLTKATNGKSVSPSIAIPNSTNNTQSITIYPSYLSLDAGDVVEFCVFTLPQDYSMDANDNLWSVTIESSRGTFTYKMRPDKVENKDITYKIKAGQIHKVNIPVKTVVDPTPLKPGEWLEQIPRNVYLSELSIPGAWYATDSNYQGSIGLGSDTNSNDIDDGLESLYNIGVRAFHIDCRASGPNAQSYNLYCAGTENSNGVGTTVLSKLESLSKLVKSNEYLMVILTISDKEKTQNNNSLGSVDPKVVVPMMYNLLNTNKDNIKLHYQTTRTDEKGNPIIRYGIDANTLVNDVLGKIVVKINVNTSDENFKTYIPSIDPDIALFSEGSMAPSSSGNIIAGIFNKMNSPYMYWGDTKIGNSDSDITNPTMKYYYHQAQLTTDEINEFNQNSSQTGPNFGSRMTAISDIISQSGVIYKSGLHNAFFQLGIGGMVKYQGIQDADVHGCVAEYLNKYTIDEIDKKISNKDLSPVGIVLMNYCATSNITETYNKGLVGIGARSHTYVTYGPDLVNKILSLNTMFYLNRNHEQPEWPDKEKPQLAQNAAYAEVGEDVF